jgi:hypothetical protein
MLVLSAQLLYHNSKERTITTSSIYFTKHALQQMARRHITPEEVLYTLRFGEQVHRTGAVFFILRRRDIPREDRWNECCVKREGTVVVLEEDAVVTVYRNRSAYHDVRKKLKYQVPKTA